MEILVINCGSSSSKYQLINMENESVMAKGLCKRIGIEGSEPTHQPSGKDEFVIERSIPAHRTTIEMVVGAPQDANHGVIKDTSKTFAIGHRVLHGGTVYNDSVVVNEDVKRVVRECFDLEPLHNPANLIGIEACEATIPRAPSVVVFDTVFGTSMPEEAYVYTIPHGYFEKYGIRRYGFHGTNHRSVSAEAIKLDSPDLETVKVIVCHPGNGSNASASIGGKYVGTSMGLTPPERLIMGTRSGSVDPVVFQFIMNKEGLDVNEILNILNKRSGIYGMTNDISGDFRGVEDVKVEGNHLAEVALDAFIYRVARYVGAYAVAMDGVDAIAFITGVGENDKAGRKAICENLVYMDVRIDDGFNNIHGEERVISSADSKVKVTLIPANEEPVIAREILSLIQ